MLSIQPATDDQLVVRSESIRVRMISDWSTGMIPRSSWELDSGWERGDSLPSDWVELEFDLAFEFYMERYERIDNPLLRDSWEILRTNASRIPAVIILCFVWFSCWVSYSRISGPSRPLQQNLKTGRERIFKERWMSARESLTILEIPKESSKDLNQLPEGNEVRFLNKVSYDSLRILWGFFIVA